MLKTKEKISFKINRLSFLLLVMILMSQNVQSQEAGRFRLSFIAERGQYDDVGRITQNYGLYTEFYLSDNVSVGYQFSIGQADNGQSDTTNVYGHITMGSYAASFPFRRFVETEDEFYLYLTMLAIALPETINFHIWLSDNFHVSPYIAPFGIEYEKIDDRDSYQASFAAGLRLNVFAGDVSIAPFAAVRNTWNGKSGWGYIAGFMVGTSF